MEGALREKIEKNRFILGILGLGRMGLPIAIKFASKKVQVIGLDINESLLRSVSSGSMPFKEENTQPLLREALKSKKLEVTSDEGRLGEADVIIICIGMSLDEEIRPDFASIISALKTLKPALHESQLIIVRSTVSPGTCVNVIKPFIEEQTSLVVGKDLFLAACPERVVEGSVMEELETLPEIIGGVDPASAELAAAVFAKLGKEKSAVLMDSTSAEVAKLFSNVFRYVRFAIANEYALIAEHYGVNAHQIISTINKDYPREHIPLPGPCGGPNFSKDGYFLLENAAIPDFILNAWKLNENIPAYIVKRLRERLKEKGKRLEVCKVGVLGMAYKAEVDDLRQSPSLRMIEILKKAGARVYAFDPFCSSDGLDTVLKDADAVVLMTNHSAFREISPAYAKKQAKKDCIFFDAWGMWDMKEWSKEKMDLQVFGGPPLS
ncbi:MAG: nucleotide sugar dehydrogenase [Candidatus Eremiobacteraeota bacterium]|nr:nucleotide sugar dehydrogenase [Candidatus Eremiobacteraeota bacterium]